MDIEISHQPRRPDMTYLPPALVEHFASLGQQLGLRKHSPDVLGMDYTIGWRPLEVGTVPEDVRAHLRAAFEVRDDHAYRGDCLLAVRSFNARDHQQQVSEEVREAQQDDHRWVEQVEDQMQELARRTGRATGNQLLVGNVPHLRDQILTGPEPRRRPGRPPRVS